MEKHLQTLNPQKKSAVWCERIPACRSSGRAWCEENGISTASYNKCQKKLFCLAVQSSPKFAAVCVLRWRPKFPLPCMREMFWWTFIRAQILRQRPWCCRSHSVMLNEFTGVNKVYIACGYTDLRWENDGWPASFTGSFSWICSLIHCFLGPTLGQNQRTILGGGGFLLMYKWLEGSSFRWLRSGEKARMLTLQQYCWLMEGLNKDQPKAHRPINRLKHI